MDEEFKKQQEECLKKIDELVKTYNFHIRLGLDFPQFRELPIDLQLALQIIQKYEGKYIFTVVKKEDK